MGGVLPSGRSSVRPEFVFEDDLLPDHAGETYRGLDGLRRAWIAFAEPFEATCRLLLVDQVNGRPIVSWYLDPPSAARRWRGHSLVLRYEISNLRSN